LSGYRRSKRKRSSSSCARSRFVRIDLPGRSARNECWRLPREIVRRRLWVRMDLSIAALAVVTVAWPAAVGCAAEADPLGSKTSEPRAQASGGPSFEPETNKISSQRGTHRPWAAGGPAPTGKGVVQASPRPPRIPPLIGRWGLEDPAPVRSPLLKRGGRRGT
jgi:hypothetical protein